MIFQIEKWSCYLLALLSVLVLRSNVRWARRRFENTDLQTWAWQTKTVFLDIDDTLAPHGVGLTAEVCGQLNRWSDEHRVILLTNCSAQRRDVHRSNMEKHNARFEMWPVGWKPNIFAMSRRLREEGIDPKDCTMVGDRPTMDLWMAHRLGFKDVVWMLAFGRNRGWSRPLKWIQNLEWKLISP